ncbi:hypothetical protein [Roseateles sp. P5_E7]
MSPVIDTLIEMFGREPLAFVLWAEAALLPVLLPMALAAARRPVLDQRRRFVLSAAVRIVGYPALVVLWVVVPWTAFELFLAPVVLDAYPASKTWLAVPLEMARSLAAHGFWGLPLLWPVWVSAAAVHVMRRWPTRAGAADPSA